MGLSAPVHQSGNANTKRLLPPPAPARLVVPEVGVAAVAGALPPPVLPATLSRNDAGQTTVRAVRLTGNLQLDGTLDEAFYSTFDPISDFIQYEPVSGVPPTEKTEVWLFLDDTHFYVTAHNWHSAPESEWIANEMRRDSFNLLSNEHFGFMLDTFYHRRNGIIVNVTPIGGRIEVSPQFALEPGLSINRIELPQGSFTTQLVTTRATYTFSPACS